MYLVCKYCMKLFNKSNEIDYSFLQLMHDLLLSVVSGSRGRGTRTPCHGLQSSQLHLGLHLSVPDCPPPGGTVMAWVTPSRTGELYQSSVVCVTCSRLLSPYLVCFLSLFPVIYELIRIQLCLSHYLWLYCVFIVLSIQLIWSGLLVTPRCSCLCQPCLVLPCLDWSH